jgi:2-oxopent-4-enoate/cis-2-oxohex-4-enoate hydratase
MLARRIAAGERVVGKKIGVTSKAVMDMLGVFQPDFGWLTDGMVFNEGEAVSASSLIQPKAEGEIAFLLKNAPGPGRDGSRCAGRHRGRDGLFRDRRLPHPRLEDQDPGHGGRQRQLRRLCAGRSPGRPARCGPGHLRHGAGENGEIVATGAGAAALGHPANAVAWLANTLGAHGIALEAGEVVLSGSLAAMVPVKAGDNLRVTIGGIGSCSVRFV